MGESNAVRGFCVLSLCLVGCGPDAVIAEVTGDVPLVQACDSATPALPAAPGAFCEEGGWCWDSPTPAGRSFSRIARVGDAIWATSSGGIVKYDGKEWTALESPIAGTGMIWGAPDGTAFVEAESANTVARNDGAVWTSWTLPGSVWSLDASASSSVWVLVDTEEDNDVMGRALLRFDGNDWVPSAALPVSLDGISVVTDQDVWGYSEYVGVYHFDGKVWARMLDLSAYADGQWSVRALRAMSRDDVWLGLSGYRVDAKERDPGGLVDGAGEGALLRYDGTSFSRVDTKTVAAVTAIFGDDGSDVWLGTDLGEVAHFDGSRVSVEDAPTNPRTVHGFARAPDGKLFAIAHGDRGSRWQMSGTVLERQDGTWTDHSASGSLDYATKVWGSAWNDVWAVGTRGLRLHFDGQRWEKREPARDTITGIWGSSRTNVWTVSRNGDIDHFDGQGWKTVQESELGFTDVWGLTGNELWLSVEYPGCAAHYTDGKLTALPVCPDGGRAVWASSSTDVWIARPERSSESLLHFTGDEWVEEPTVWEAHDIWGRGADDIYVLTGFFGEIHHFDGRAWTKQEFKMPITDDLGALWGCGDRDVFVSNSQSMAHFDGEAWTQTPQYTYGITDLWAASPNFAVAVGNAGQILRKSR